MDKVQKQRGSIVLHKETRDGADYIRIEYANSQAVTQLLAQDTGMEMAGNGSAYMASAAFSLPDFYDRYSPHAYIDYSRVYVWHPKPKREYTLPKGYLELLEQKRYSPSTVKTYRAYFSDFMEYHKGRNIDRLKVPDINKYILYLVNEKKISVSQQNMRINAIKFYYEQVKGGKRQYYGGITRAKEYKSQFHRMHCRDSAQIITPFVRLKKSQFRLKIRIDARHGAQKLLALLFRKILTDLRNDAPVAAAVERLHFFALGR